MQNQIFIESNQISIIDSNEEINLCSHISINGKVIPNLLITKEKRIYFMIRCRSCVKKWEIKKLVEVSIKQITQI